MRAIVQRANGASVVADGRRVGGFEGPGLVVLLGVTHSDTTDDASRLARKIREMRIMRDEQSAAAIAAPLLVVSQFTLYADLRKGRRPSWSMAAPGAVSEPLYDTFCRELRDLGAQVETGVFGADMALTLTNDGPVTIIVES
jgi:D-tyrosyl-tRNA(Tyr) deacylase